LSPHSRARTPGRRAESSLTRTLAKAPGEQRHLADGRDARDVLRDMVREWAEIRGGVFHCEPTGSRWSHLSDDAMVIGDHRPLGLSTDLCAISDHAMARTFASGYRDPIIGYAPPVSYWSTITTLEDVLPVALAVLDRELTGGVAFLDWYLRTPCLPNLCRHHADGEGTPYCGSVSCSTASPGSVCDCVCGGVNHGMGEDSTRPPKPTAPDWSSAPSPLWHRGSGSVEVDREHRRVAGRDPYIRHGARVRPPSLAWTSRSIGA